MKQKLRELRAKLQIKKGSILVYTLIVMMIMLSTALSIFAVAVREKKGAGTTAASMQAFAVADSGSEIALNKIANVSTLAEIGSCASGGIVTGSIGAGMDYTLTFYDSGGNQLLNCTDSVSAVDKVKSVGRYGGTARAVEVAVAQAVEPVGTCYSKDEMLYIKFANSCGSGWHQCTETEIINAAGIGCLPSVSQYFGNARGFLSGNTKCLIAVASSDFSPAWSIPITGAEVCFSAGKACCMD